MKECYHENIKPKTRRIKIVDPETGNVTYTTVTVYVCKDCGLELNV